jgi:hypothetical protein
LSFNVCVNFLSAVLLHELDDQNMNPPRVLLWSLSYEIVDIYIAGILTVANLARHTGGILVGWCYLVGTSSA